MGGWKKARGTLGPIAPLLGRWAAPAARMPDGATGDCSREYKAFGASFVRLEAAWDMGGRGVYREIAFFGKGADGVLTFWSFTVDGKRSVGVLCDATDVHRDAIGFVSEMPAGIARMVYWPDDRGAGFYFAVENKVKKGWNRFLEHRYQPA